MDNSSAIIRRHILLGQSGVYASLAGPILRRVYQPDRGGLFEKSLQWRNVVNAIIKTPPDDLPVEAQGLKCWNSWRAVGLRAILPCESWEHPALREVYVNKFGCCCSRWCGH